MRDATSEVESGEGRTNRTRWPRARRLGRRSHAPPCGAAVRLKPRQGEHSLRVGPRRVAGDAAEEVEALQEGARRTRRSKEVMVNEANEANEAVEVSSLVSIVSPWCIAPRVGDRGPGHQHHHTSRPQSLRARLWFQRVMVPLVNGAHAATEADVPMCRVATHIPYDRARSNPCSSRSNIGTNSNDTSAHRHNNVCTRAIRSPPSDHNGTSAHLHT